VDGGHDLTGPIDEMIGEHGAECSGTIRCQGWQDRERIGKHRCWCELTYTVKCVYND
jgi:hypothetical protein